MAYIGNTAENQSFGPAVDFFNGTGSQTTFTLSRPVASYAQIQVIVENVPQNPSDAFSVSGNSLNFTSAPPSGTNNIYVYYVSSISQAFYPAPGTTQNLALVVTPTNISPANGSVNVIPSTLTASTFYDLYSYTFANTQWQVATDQAFTSIVVNSGDTTASTSYALSIGSFSTSTVYYWRVRYKNSNGDYSAWSTPFMFTTASVFPYSVEYISVAGGGGGGNNAGAGAGAGGYLTGTFSATPSTAYTVTIGGGGATDTNGSNSSVFSATSLGGGKGGGRTAGPTGGNGGSGGGGSADGGTAGTGTVGQGRNGANGGPAGGGTFGGGGGGANAAGSGANGGAGIADTWTGSSRTLGGGGGGFSSGTGGAGGGGAYNTAGTANTGGGGGGGAVGGNGAAGGSGIVVLRYSGSQRGSGGTVTSSGGFTIHTFTSSGTYTA